MGRWGGITARVREPQAQWPVAPGAHRLSSAAVLTLVRKRGPRSWVTADVLLPRTLCWNNILFVAVSSRWLTVLVCHSSLRWQGPLRSELVALPFSEWEHRSPTSDRKWSHGGLDSSFSASSASYQSPVKCPLPRAISPPPHPRQKRIETEPQAAPCSVVIALPTK